MILKNKRMRFYPVYPAPVSTNIVNVQVVVPVSMTKSIPADAVSATIIPIVFGFNNVYDNMEELIAFHSKEVEDPENFSVLEIEYADVSGGCLITTATYGSELAPQVQQLRELRDNIVLSTESGAAFMESFF